MATAHQPRVRQHRRCPGRFGTLPFNVPLRRGGPKGRYPAEQLLEIYHRRWQAETCYFSLKSTILDGRVLRSRSVPGLEQEIFALLTVYQALFWMAGDVTTARPGLPAERLSFVTLFQAAADQIIAAHGFRLEEPVSLIGAIGRAALDNLLPERHRCRVKARYRKSASKYGFKRGDHPCRAQAYTLRIQVIPDDGLDNGSTS
ncbi:transposase [Streptomyces sp. NPDC056165]|uniref:transposase n=1 Tax=Streptomyces sp. NPDC056165 TaxID=3345733 RepID=UPI0035D9877C